MHFSEKQGAITLLAPIYRSPVKFCIHLCKHHFALSVGNLSFYNSKLVNDELKVPTKT